MATRKKTETAAEDAGMKLLTELVSEIYQIRKTQAGWYPIIDEIAGNSNWMKDINNNISDLNTTMTRIADALEKISERPNT